VAFDLREDQNHPAAKREDANMASEPESEQKTAQSSGFAAEAAKKTDSAISNTAQKYISRTRTKEVETAIRNKPLAATALAAAAGFIVGGGMASRPGLLILALLGRKAAREIAITLPARWYGVECPKLQKSLSHLLSVSYTNRPCRSICCRQVGNRESELKTALARTSRLRMGGQSR
jgi:ElaB/YqjD/DUF883 family membrane-anchored ribosome-binding protein